MKYGTVTVEFIWKFQVLFAIYMKIILINSCVECVYARIYLCYIKIVHVK